jgi:DNA repair protein RadD
MTTTRPSEIVLLTKAYIKSTTNFPEKQERQVVEAENSQKVFTVPATANSIHLRDYQHDSVQQTRKAFALSSGHRGVQLTLGTGAGKTIIGGEIIRLMIKAGKLAYFVMHRIELLDQGAEALRKMGIEVGIIAAGYEPNPSAPCQVCMVQTLAGRLDGIDPSRYPAYVVIDESHHATAGQYAAIIKKFPDAKLLGLSATPERNDQSGLGDVFDVLLQPVQLQWLIEQGRIVKPLYYAPEIDLTGLHARGGEFVAAEAVERMGTPILYKRVVEKYLEYGRNLPAICFNITREHSEATAAAFRAAGVSAMHLDGETPKDVRKQILRDFDAGEMKLLCNVNLFGEGFDAPNCACVIMNRPTKSRAFWFQAVGRGARPTAGLHEGTAEERLAAIAASDKPRFVVIDHGGNLARFGWWEQPITYSLTTSKLKGKKTALDVAPMKSCKSCGLHTSSQTRICEECSTPFPSILDRTKDAEFAATEYLRNTPVAIVEKPKPISKMSLWPNHLQKHYHRPARMTEDEIRLVQRTAGYAPGWVHMVLQRKQAFNAGK